MPSTRRRTRRLSRAAAALARSALLAAGLATATAACAEVHEPVIVAIRDSAGVEIVENPPEAARAVPRWTVAAEPGLRIGVLEGDPAYMFDNPWAAASLPDGRIPVIDLGSRQVRVFGRDGHVVAVQGREGDYPGEYRSPMGLWLLTGDSLAVFDPALARVTALTGLHDDTLAPARVATLRHGLMNPQHAGTVDDGRRVAILDMEFDVSGPIGPQYADVWTIPIAGAGDRGGSGGRESGGLRSVWSRWRYKGFSNPELGSVSSTEGGG